MFDITKIEIENFKSYKQKHTFKFPKEPGVYSLTGENLAQPRLGPNGAGKTSFLDAIFWALYGRTTRGLKAVDIRNWHIEPRTRCGVRIWLTVADSKLVVTRTQSPNSLTVKVGGNKAETVTQDRIDELIRLKSETFLHSVILPQLGDMFFDMKPASKLTLFSEIMELDYWLLKSDKSKELSREIDSEIKRTELHLSNLKGKFEVLENSLVQTERLVDQFEEERETEIVRLRHDIKKTKDKNKEDEINLLKAKEDRDTYVYIDSKIKVDRNLIAGEISDIKQDRLRLNTDIIGFINKIDVHKSNIQRLRNIEGTCPICNQSVTKKHVNEEANRIKKQIKEIEKKITAIKGTINNLDILIDAKEGKANTLRLEYESTIKKYQIAQDKFTSMKIKKENSGDNVRKLGNDLSEKKRKKNPHLKTLKDNEVEINVVSDKIDRAEDYILNETEHFEEISFWINGFKKIRLFIIEETIRQLEIEVNNNLVSLGLTDWYIEFDIEKENKSGGVTTGFSVFIYSPDNEKPVKWEAWSGGETQRLKLAGNLGLSHLIADTCGLQFKAEYFDELSAHMSEEGIDDMLDTLQQRALETNCKIWLVDHRVMDQGCFSGILKVIKDEEGSSLEYTSLGEGE